MEINESCESWVKSEIGLSSDLITSLDEGISKLLSYCDQEWKFVSNSDNVTISKLVGPKVPGVSTCAKGVGMLPAPPVVVANFLRDYSRRCEWDSLFNEMAKIETINGFTQVIRTSYKPLWPASARDLCTMTHLRALANGTVVILIRSLEHPKCPEVKDYVRGEISLAGFIMKPISGDPKSCEMTYISQIDFKGNIPSAVKKFISLKSPRFVANIRKVLEKEDYSRYNTYTKSWEQLTPSSVN